MKSIPTKNSVVHFNDTVYKAINKYVEAINPSKLFIIVDTNTHEYCLPLFLPQLVTHVDIEIIEIPDGEAHKTIDICNGVWQTLADFNADRKSLIINLGGGVVTDLGAFVASTYMRGINFINIPTSLLAMVDASVGGKTGVDLGVLKNLIGAFCEGAMVAVDTNYLNTLPKSQMISGFAEMLKHGLIYDENYWNKLTKLENLTTENLGQLIYNSVQIKNAVVTEDPKEQGLRKILNFGHTLGHAIESFFLQSEKHNTLLHGEAIATGMILEAYLSNKVLNLTGESLTNITYFILKWFPKILIEENDISEILSYLKHDKKNSHGIVNFVLLEAISQPKTDCQVSMDNILEAFEYYRNY